MIELACAQGNYDWIVARLGRLTTSEFPKLVTAKRLERSAQADAYIDRCVAEWCTGAPDSEFMGTFWTDRGSQLESEARAWFELETGLSVRDVGFIYRDERRDCGGSTDGIVHDGARDLGVLELKCPKTSTHIGYLRGDGLPDRYRLQVQGELWVTGLPRAWWMSYSPVPDMPPVLVEVEPDPEVFAAFDEVIPQVLKEIRTMKDLLAAYGVEPATPADPSTWSDMGDPWIDVGGEQA